MRRFLAVAVLGLAAIVLMVYPALAAGPYGISVSGAAIPFIAGDAGDGANAPKYKDAFDTGFGGRVELYYDYTPMFRGQVGGTYQQWGGSTFRGVTFDDLKMWAIYVGGKARFLPGSKFRPYVVADAGYAHLEKVDVFADVTSGLVTIAGTLPYWDKTDTWMADLGVGAEYMVMPNLGIYLDVRGQIFWPPDEILKPAAEADSGVSLPISLGVNFNF